MAQINEITAYIADKYKSEADKIISDAKAECDEVMKKAEIKAKDETDKIISAAKADAEKRSETAGSSAKQLIARGVLERKNAEVKVILEKAKEKIRSMTDAEYNAFLLKLLESKAEPKPGEVIFNKKDGARLNDDTIDAFKKHNLKKSCNTADIDAGFILKYGSIEENCSMDAIFREKSEQLTDYINSNLFK